MVDVEDQGSISRGATIIDRRSQAPEAHDLELATSVDAEAVRDLVIRSFRYAGQSSE
jgi:inosine-uridine nucleoside N-ribohydrolase